MNEENPVRVGTHLSADIGNAPRTSAQGYLMVALTETKENALSPEGIKGLVRAYNVAGLALAVYDHEKQAWVKLTKEMLAS